MRDRLKQLAGWSWDAWGAAAFAIITAGPAFYALSSMRWPR